MIWKMIYILYATFQEVVKQEELNNQVVVKQEELNNQLDIKQEELNNHLVIKQEEKLKSKYTQAVDGRPGGGDLTAEFLQKYEDNFEDNYENYHDGKEPCYTDTDEWRCSIPFFVMPDIYEDEDNVEYDCGVVDDHNYLEDFEPDDIYRQWDLDE